MVIIILQVHTSSAGWGLTICAAFTHCGKKLPTRQTWHSLVKLSSDWNDGNNMHMNISGNQKQIGRWYCFFAYSLWCSILCTICSKLAFSVVAILCNFVDVLKVKLQKHLFLPVIQILWPRWPSSGVQVVIETVTLLCLAF
jgi:hypothetical protein